MTQLSIPNAYDLALQHHRAGQLAEAEQIYRQILQVQPKHPGALNHLGMIAHQVGQLDAAINLFRLAVDAVPTYPEAHDNLGNVLRTKGLFDEAIAAHRKASQLSPRSAPIRNNIGLAFMISGRLGEAIVAYNEALTIDPNYAASYCNLSSALFQERLFDAAISAAQTAIKLNPQLAQAYGNLGIVLSEIGQSEAALAAFNQSISLQPNIPDSHLNAAILQLKLGNYLQGFKQYEWRERCDNFASMRRDFKQPNWDGSPLNGRTLLLHAEQGLGDAIQFSRYLPMIQGKIIFEVQPDLEQLFQVFADRCQIICRGQPLPEFDVRCSLLSLPRIFKTTIESIPAKVPYLFADSNLIDLWQKKLSPGDGKLKVALTWAGNPTFAGDYARSISLDVLAPLAKATGIDFYSVQKGYAQQQMQHLPPGLKMTDLSPDLHDMAQTAAAISLMDLVITTDTSVAHLAGALGRPVWVMLSFAADWRWLTDRQDCPWYPSMRLFRQSSLGDWAGVTRQIIESLNSISR